MGERKGIGRTVMAKRLNLMRGWGKKEGGGMEGSVDSLLPAHICSKLNFKQKRTT